MKCRADPAQAPGLGGGGLVWVRVQEHSMGGGSAAVLTLHTHFSLQRHKPPTGTQPSSPLPLVWTPQTTLTLHTSTCPHEQILSNTSHPAFPRPQAPTNTPTRPHGHLPTTTPRPQSQALTPPPSRTPTFPPRHPYALPRSPLPAHPTRPQVPPCPPGRSAPRTAPRPVSREEPPPRYSAVTWRGGCWGCRRRPYIARSGRAARVAGAAGGAAAAVSIPPTSHPSPLPGRGS